RTDLDWKPFQRRIKVGVLIKKVAWPVLKDPVFFRILCFDSSMEIFHRESTRHPQNAEQD
ncbi:hypothetical protein OFB72_29150, partial [Escherichia coli]|nr:hypothetical protein [Escherichia coli]